MKADSCSITSDSQEAVSFAGSKQPAAGEGIRLTQADLDSLMLNGRKPYPLLA
jgi:hypothetical protein